MNKKIIIITIVLTILIVVPAIILNLKHEKFYINDKYYNNGEFIKITSNDLNNLIKNENDKNYTVIMIIVVLKYHLMIYL